MSYQITPGNHLIAFKCLIEVDTEADAQNLHADFQTNGSLDVEPDRIHELQVRDVTDLIDNSIVTNMDGSMKCQRIMFGQKFFACTCGGNTFFTRKAKPEIANCACCHKQFYVVRA